MTANEIKTQLINLGISEGFVDIVSGEVSVSYDALERAHNDNLKEFVDICPKEYTDKGIFFIPAM